MAGMGNGSVQWSLVIYAAGCNDLGPEIGATLTRLKAIAIPEPVEVFMYVTVAPAGLVRLLRPTERAQLSEEPVTQCLVTDPDSRRLAPEYRKIIPGPAHQPSVLFSFLVRALRSASGRRVVVALAGHSAGYLGAIEDCSTGYPMLMTFPALVGAIQDAQRASGRVIDILLLDMCDMGLIEILYEFSKSAVAQYAIIPGNDAPLAGVPYEQVIRVLAACPESIGSEKATVRLCNTINDMWKANSEGECFGVRLDFEVMDAFRVELEGVIGEWLVRSQEHTRGQVLASIRALLNRKMASLLVTGKDGTGAAALRSYWPADEGRFAGLAPVYRQLQFARRSRWPVFASSRVLEPQSTFPIRPAIKPERGQLALPREMLLDHLREIDPGISVDEAARRLSQLGWNSPRRSAGFRK